MAIHARLRLPVKLYLRTLLLVLLGSTSTLLFGITGAKQQDAYIQKLVHKATGYFCKNGAHKTSKLLSRPLKKPGAPEAYMWIYTPEGQIIAHGANKSLLGKNITQITGINGKTILQAKLRAINNKQKAGWAEYMLQGKRRRNYVHAVQDKTGVYLLGAGYTVVA